MYRTSKFLGILHQIRQQMAEEGEYEIGRFLQMVRQEPTGGEMDPESMSQPVRRKARRTRSRKVRKDAKRI